MVALSSKYSTLNILEMLEVFFNILLIFSKFFLFCGSFFPLCRFAQSKDSTGHFRRMWLPEFNPKPAKFINIKLSHFHFTRELILLTRTGMCNEKISAFFHFEKVTQASWNICSGNLSIEFLTPKPTLLSLVVPFHGFLNRNCGLNGFLAILVLGAMFHFTALGFSSAPTC